MLYGFYDRIFTDIPHIPIHKDYINLKNSVDTQATKLWKKQRHDIFISLY